MSTMKSNFAIIIFSQKLPHSAVMESGLDDDRPLLFDPFAQHLKTEEESVFLLISFSV